MSERRDMPNRIWLQPSGDPLDDAVEYVRVPTESERRDDIVERLEAAVDLNGPFPEQIWRELAEDALAKIKDLDARLRSERRAVADTEEVGEALYLLDGVEGAEEALRQYRAGMTAEEARVLDRAITSLTAARHAKQVLARLRRTQHVDSAGTCSATMDECPCKLPENHAGLHYDGIVYWPDDDSDRALATNDSP